MACHRTLFLICAFILNMGCQACRNGWISFNGSCYLFSRTTVDWPDALAICNAMNSHLLEIETAEEDNFIRTTLQSLQAKRSVNSNGYWIGMSDIEVTNSWRWMNSDRLLSYSRWHPSEPTNDRNEDCGVLWTPYNFDWGDYYCNNNAEAFICEGEQRTEGGQIIG